MRSRYWITGVFVLMVHLYIFAGEPFPQDSLTTEICNNEEQIVSRRTNEWRIGYYMGETELNMKTISGFLMLNAASKPQYNQYRFRKTAGWILFFGGIGLIIADGQISGPPEPLLPLGGLAMSITGAVVGYRSNGAFRLAIRAYNRDICNIK